MRLSEAARKLGISATSLRRLDRRGVVRLARDLSGHRRVSDGELEMLRRIIYPPTADTASSPGVLTRAPAPPADTGG